MKKLQPLLIPLLLLLALVTMGWLLLNRESEVLFRAQELSLWLPTCHFYETSIIYPGGTLTWAAAYLTQFFFHPWVGVLLLVLFWAAIMWLTCRLMRLKGVWQALSLLVPMALLACVVQMDYWLYYMKLQGHLWVPTLGVFFALLLAMPMLRITNRWGRLAWIALVGILGYPLMGAWSFLALGLMLLPSLSRPWKENLWEVGLALILIVVVPFIMVQQFYGQVEMKNAHLAAMPSFQYGENSFQEYRWAYIALPIAFILCALPHWLNLKEVAVKKGKETEAWPWKQTVLVALLLVLGAFGIHNRWYRDTNFHKEVAMTNAIHDLDWERVLHIMLSQEMGEQMPPTRVMVMMKNLALFRLGRAGDEMFRYPEGAEQQHAPWQVKITQVGGKLLYYNYGKEGFCYRWCMEDGVEFGWSIDVLKYMTKTSLLTHDWEVARKYIEILKRTRYHKEWAEHFEQFINHPELMKEDKEMKPIVPMSSFSDRLDGDNTLVELYLMKTFSAGYGADPYYQEMTVLSSLIMKDIDLFWPRFHQYINMHQKEEGFHVPIHYQEAAYLYSMLEPNRPSELWPGKTNAEVAEHLPFDASIKESYRRFMEFNSQCGSMTEEQKKVAFRPQFGDTFYYFYFLVRNQKTN